MATPPVATPPILIDLTEETARQEVSWEAVLADAPGGSPNPDDWMFEDPWVQEPDDDDDMPQNRLSGYVSS